MTQTNDKDVKMIIQCPGGFLGDSVPNEVYTRLGVLRQMLSLTQKDAKNLHTLSHAHSLNLHTRM